MQFDRSIHALTMKNHDRINEDAELALNNKEIHEAEAAYSASDDELVRHGHTLKK